jgi:hypothetical protein
VPLLVPLVTVHCRTRTDDSGPATRSDQREPDTAGQRRTTQAVSGRPYKAKVGGSSPSAPTRKARFQRARPRHDHRQRTSLRTLGAASPRGRGDRNPHLIAKPSHLLASASNGASTPLNACPKAEARSPPLSVPSTAKRHHTHDVGAISHTRSFSQGQAQFEHRVNPFASSCLWGYEKEPTRGARARRDG